MAAEISKTSFQQFEFCSLCKMSHTKRKKHIYSKHHQTVLNTILKKFVSKISAMKQCLFSPVVMELDFERGAKFWCYFCVEECSKHWVIEDACTVVGGGILEHIASDSHKEGMEKFFWDNLLNKKMKPNFVLSKEDLHIFKRAALLAMKKFEKAKRLERDKIAEAINQSEIRRQVVSQSESRPDTGRLEVGTSQQEDGFGTSQQEDGLGTRVPQKLAGGKRTVSAYAPGLTCILQDRYLNEEEGNIHTGATPPWLRKDDSKSQSDVIGPTMTDYQKHLEREKKAKLPSIRVGAKFDHNIAPSAEWLPSFGRVWTKGRRLQSKMHFVKELKLYKGVNSSPPHTNSRQTVEILQRKDSPANSTTEQGSNEQHSMDMISHEIQGHFPYTINMTEPARPAHMELMKSSQYRAGRTMVKNDREYSSTSPYPMKSIDSSHEYSSHEHSKGTWKSAGMDASHMESNVVPYKRKYVDETVGKWMDPKCVPYGQKNATSGEVIESSCFVTSHVHVVPYKRKREAPVRNNTNHIELIQTPVLANKH